MKQIKTLLPRLQMLLLLLFLSKQMAAQTNFSAKQLKTEAWKTIVTDTFFQRLVKERGASHSKWKYQIALIDSASVKSKYEDFVKKHKWAKDKDIHWIYFISRETPPCDYLIFVVEKPRFAISIYGVTDKVDYSKFCKSKDYTHFLERKKELYTLLWDGLALFGTIDKNQQSHLDEYYLGLSTPQVMLFFETIIKKKKLWG